MRVNVRHLRRGALVATIVATAIGIVYSRHESRRLFVELQQLESQRDALNVEWGQLQLEQATAAKASRIEQVAANELGLRPMDESVLLEIDP